MIAVVEIIMNIILAGINETKMLQPKQNLGSSPPSQKGEKNCNFIHFLSKIKDSL